MNQFRTLLVFSCFMFFSGITLKAQRNAAHQSCANANNKHLPTIKNRNRIAAILQQQQTKLLQKQVAADRTTSYTSERLIGASTYNFSDSILYYLGKTDSEYFKYSGERGSKLNKDAIGFFGVFGNQFTVGDMPLLMSAGLVHTSFDGLYPSDVVADSSIIWSSLFPDSTGRYAYGIEDIYSNTYSSANMVLNCYEQTLPGYSGNYYNYINTYNTSNNITYNLELMWDGTSWDTVENTYFTYDGSGQLIKDSINDWISASTWSPTSKDDYNYNSLGNLTYSDAFDDSSGYWLPANTFYFTYNSDNTLLTDSANNYSSGSGWSPSLRDSFGYTPGINYYTYWEWKNYFDDTTIEITIQSKHVLSSGLTDIVYSSNNLDSMSFPVSNIHNTQKNEYTYDSYNNPILSIQNNFIVTNYTTGSGAYTTTPDYVNHWYYEPYSAEGVPAISKNIEKINIFPNPTTGTISINRPGIVIGTYTNIIIINANGQIMKSESLPFMNETETISIADLNSGIYSMLIYDRNGNNLATQKIVKL